MTKDHVSQHGAYRDPEPSHDPAVSPRPSTPWEPAPPGTAQVDMPRADRLPRRAEPLQPDRPGRGEDGLPDKQNPAKQRARSTKKAQAKSGRAGQRA